MFSHESEFLLIGLCQKFLHKKSGEKYFIFVIHEKAFRQTYNLFQVL